MKIHIVEDEINNAELLSDQISLCFPDFEHTGVSRTVQEAIQSLQKFEPNIVFLDVELFGGTGFDVIEAFEHPEWKIIFCTGYDNYAIRAFKVAAIDYLLKPIAIDELKSAVEKAMLLHTQEESIKSIKETYGSKENSHIIIPDRHTAHRLQFDNIIRITSDGPYSIFELADNRVITASKTLGYYETLLPGKQFGRVHHSAIVNKSFVREFDKDLGILILTNNAEQQVSIRKLKQIKSWL